MVKTDFDLTALVQHYAHAAEAQGVPVERIIAYGSCVRGEMREDSDIDLAVFSEAFGPPDYRELSGVLSRAKREVEPMIEAIGYPPAELQRIQPISFLGEIVRTGQVTYQRGQSG
jgi:predicted nucleotidyltransferase